MSPDPLVRARALLPVEQVSAAGVFGVQDQMLATGLLGAERVAATAAALVQPDPSLGPYLPWIPIPLLVAVSDESIHILDWQPETGAGRELARFPREVTAVTVESADAARRMTLTDTRTGYRLPLTTTTSRMHPYAAGARAVLEALAATSAALDPAR